MKKLFLSLIAITLTAVCYAQSTQVATLNHEGWISTFYGADALIEAHEAAENGDVITLSSGLFTATTLNKAVTIRGAGMEMESATGIAPTIINQDIEASVWYYGDTHSRLTIEGVRFNGKLTTAQTVPSPTFIKCKFKEITTTDGNYHHLTNANFIHCIITDNIYISRESSASFHNCYVNFVDGESNKVCNFENCIIGTMIGDVPSSITNSLLFGDEIIGVCAAYNCVAFNDGIIAHCQGTKNVNAYYYDTVFKEFTGTYDDNISLELTDDAVWEYLGADGTQVGIYGGTFPFDPVPSNPRIIRCDVDKRSNADGMLNVTVEVKKAE